MTVEIQKTKEYTLDDAELKSAIINHMRRQEGITLLSGDIRFEQVATTTVCVLGIEKPVDVISKIDGIRIIHLIRK